MKKRHPLVNTLFNLKGNPRACVYSEPIWAIPYNLFAPYISIYMSALGVTDAQIGLIATVGMVFQIIFALLGGIITDKLGRRKTTFIFDIIAWSIPCVIWAFSKNFIYFLIGAIVNSIAKVTMNSWGCLLVEDSDKDQILNIYTWIYIAGLVAAFFSPISGFFIGKYNIVPTIRVLYILAFVFMTLKFALLYKYSSETKQGLIRMKETRNQSIMQQLNGYRQVFKQILNTPRTLLTASIMVIMNICTVVNTTFWAIAATEKIHVQPKVIGDFAFLRSFIMLLFFFVVLPKINAIKFKKPMITGFCLFIISQLLLILTPDKGYVILIISVILESSGVSLINPLLDSMQVIMVDPNERARIIAILYVIVIFISSPFGWVAGILSGMDKRLPFLMNIILLTIGAILTYYASMVARRDSSSSQNLY